MPRQGAPRFIGTPYAQRTRAHTSMPRSSAYCAKYIVSLVTQRSMCGIKLHDTPENTAISGESTLCAIANHYASNRFFKKCIRFDTIAHTDSSQISYSTRFSKLDFPSFFIKL